MEDVHETLARTDPRTLELILSADTFIYVGALERCFALAAEKLRHRGLFAFSVESGSEQHERQEQRSSSSSSTDSSTSRGFKLQRSGRYAHEAGYIATLATRSGFVVREMRAITVRKEQAAPIPGFIYVLQLKTDE